ncbi:hypothetical protein [Steroidobacter sp.]|uniref:hypothetical protein n=1 Tax=Steroidobacter sp. TaxID=1978227 RepID=UPI001A380EB3|nr:hypothetical protein [Steroidobacter sp.]MBL8269074.1 hypothetical protein [Steroidobacter sp.]
MNKPIPDEPRSYVVRVYRRTARWFAGYVEDVRSGRVQQFRSANELWSAIGGPKRKSKSTVPRKESRS